MNKNGKNLKASQGGGSGEIEAGTPSLERLLHLFRRTSEVARIGGWEVDFSSSTIWWSDVTREIHEEPPNFQPTPAGGIDYYQEGIDRETISQAFSRAVEEGVPYDLELRIRTAKGRLRWVRTNGHPEQENGKTVRISGAFQDITEKIKAETALRASEERFKEILRNVATVSVQGYAMDGTVRYWNDASTRFYGFTAEEAIGRNLLDLIIPPKMREGVKQEIALMKATGNPIPAAELTLQRKDGSPITVYSSHSVVRIPGREPEFYCIDVDLTERKQMEDVLREGMHEAKAANRAKSEFLANMSHEIRTPMNGVIGMTDLLLETDLDKDQRLYAEVVQSSANSLLKLINDILDLSKIEAGKIEPENRPLHLPNLLEVFARGQTHRAIEKGLDLKVVVDPRLPEWVAGDSNRLRQILTNLVENAIKFTDQGTVTLKASPLSEPDGKKGTDGIQWVRISVEDTGIGISEEAREKLFQRFSQVDGSSTRKYGGSGLGLAISKQLVELMGGEIGVSSRPGEGSTFFLTLPFRPLNGPASEKESS